MKNLLAWLVFSGLSLMFNQSEAKEIMRENLKDSQTSELREVVVFYFGSHDKKGESPLTVTDKFFMERSKIKDFIQEFSKGKTEFFEKPNSEKLNIYQVEINIWEPRTDIFNKEKIVFNERDDKYYYFWGKGKKEIIKLPTSP